MWGKMTKEILVNIFRCLSNSFSASNIIIPLLREAIFCLIVCMCVCLYVCVCRMVFSIFFEEIWPILTSDCSMYAFTPFCNLSDSKIWPFTVLSRKWPVMSWNIIKEGCCLHPALLSSDLLQNKTQFFTSGLCTCCIASVKKMVINKIVLRCIF